MLRKLFWLSTNIYIQQQDMCLYKNFPKFKINLSWGHAIIITSWGHAIIITWYGLIYIMKLVTKVNTDKTYNIFVTQFCYS